MWDAEAVHKVQAIRDKAEAAIRMYREMSAEEVDKVESELLRMKFDLEQSYPDMPPHERHEVLYVVALAFLHVGYRYRQLNKGNMEEFALRKTTEYLNQIPAGSVPDRDMMLTVSYGERGNMYRGSGDIESAIVMYEKAVEVGEAALEQYANQPDQQHLWKQTMRVLTVALNNLGMEYDTLGEREKALLHCRRALSLAQQIDPTSSIERQIAQNVADIESKPTRSPEKKQR